MLHCDQVLGIDEAHFYRVLLFGRRGDVVLRLLIQADDHLFAFLVSKRLRSLDLWEN